MHIYWHGFSCVKLETGTASLLINPYQDSVGLTMPKLKVDIVVSTDMENVECNNIDRLQGGPKQILGPGEYEIKDVFVYGVPHGKKTLYMVEAEGLKLAHLDAVTEDLSDAQLELLEGVDVIFLPISGTVTKNLSTVVSQIEPRVIIPIQYAPAGLKTKAALDTIDAFAKEMGVKPNGDTEKKIIIKQKDLPVGEMQIKILGIA